MRHKDLRRDLSAKTTVLQRKQRCPQSRNPVSLRLSDRQYPPTSASLGSFVILTFPFYFNQCFPYMVNLQNKIICITVTTWFCLSEPEPTHLKQCPHTWVRSQTLFWFVLQRSYSGATLIPLSSNYRSRDYALFLCYAHKTTKYQQNRPTVLTWRVLCRRIRVVFCRLLTVMCTLFRMLRNSGSAHFCHSL